MNLVRERKNSGSGYTTQIRSNLNYAERKKLEQDERVRKRLEEKWELESSTVNNY